jgi:alpha-1,3-mannosyl-glycoprotein beta-1,2-N-acetylglucosaminyltransferase
LTVWVGCRRESLAYYRIANHYKFAFQQLFDCFQYDRVIVVEDDMVFAPDFFSYFEATSRVLDQVVFDP